MQPSNICLHWTQIMQQVEAVITQISVCEARSSHYNMIEKKIYYVTHICDDPLLIFETSKVDNEN